MLSVQFWPYQPQRKLGLEKMKVGEITNVILMGKLIKQIKIVDPSFEENLLKIES